MRFSKWHGIGNDYLIIESTELRSAGIELDAQLAQRLSDRHFGPGGDGILELDTADDGRPRMTIHNPDGSHAEMCGNGVRMAARYMVDRWQLPADDLELVTAGGVVRAEVRDDGTVRVDMGIPTLGQKHTVSVGGMEVTGTVVDVGNPHFVIQDTPTDSNVQGLGPLLEHHQLFPARTNVEFYEPAGPDTVRMRVWERGVGETLACGSGACATGLVAIHAGHARSPVRVELPGGTLIIEVDDDGRVHMTGPAEPVYDATLATVTSRNPAPTGA